jgi:membrane-associated protease RseP (regulator of RpoE activity)
VRYSSSNPNAGPQGGVVPFGLDQLPGTLPGGRGMQGLFIVSVAEGSPAAEAGLVQGDAITAIDGETLDRPRALVEAIQNRNPGERVTLSVYHARDGAQSEVEVTLGEHPDQAGQAYLGVTIGGMFRFFGMPGSQGGELPGGFEFRQGPFRFQMPLDQLPFNLDELPGGWQEFHRQFESPEMPGGDGDSL